MVSVSEILSCFMVLFAVIDIIGSIPVILDIRQKTGNIQPITTALVSFLLMILYLIAGAKFLSIFGVDVPSFVVAGSLILFFIALDMIRGIIPLFRVVRLFPKHIIYLFP